MTRRFSYPSCALWLVCCHAALLILASTRFTALSWLWQRWSWTFDYLRLSYGNGWGYVYQSDYSAAVVLAYVAAYSLGIAAYVMARKHVRAVPNALALILCIAGALSFSIEASHWLWDHHLSCIASCPAASLLLAVVAVVQLSGAGRRQAAGEAEPAADSPTPSPGAD